MKFSLILATYRRIEELKIFLASLVAQSDCEYELIIADQNKDNRLQKIIDEYKSIIPIKHVKTEIGLSRSRNEALKLADGDIVAFPDDDCQYTKGLLHNIEIFFKNHSEYSGVSVRWQNSLNNGLNPMPYVPSMELNKFNIIGFVFSSSLFFRRSIFEVIGGFENNMGLGSGTTFTVAEDYEFAIRAVHNRQKLFFINELVVLHPLVKPAKKNFRNKKHRIIGDGAAKYLICRRYLGLSKYYKEIFKHLLGVGYNIVKGNEEGFLSHWYRLKGMLLGKIHYSKFFSN